MFQLLFFFAPDLKQGRIQSVAGTGWFAVLRKPDFINLSS